MEDTQGLNQEPQTQANQEPAPQKMLSQDEVNRIVAREKSKAAESARREAEARHQQELEARQSQIAQAQDQRNAQMPREVDANAIYQEVQQKFNEDMARRQAEQHANQVANTYMSRIDQAKKTYSDFDQVTQDYDPVEFPQLTFLLSGMENAGDVLYELLKSPQKFATVESMSAKSPKMAQRMLQDLSSSISLNKQAMEESQDQMISKPLDRMSPSRPANSNGKMGVNDLRNQSWLRG